MKQHPTPHRRAAALLLAAAALPFTPFTPLAAQDAPVINAPPPTITAPPPASAPLSVAPPPRPVTITPQPVRAPVAARPAPAVTRATPAPARPAVRTARAAPRAAAPVRQAPAAAAPVAPPVAAIPEPIAAPPPAPAQVAPVAAPAAEPARNFSTLWPWLLAGAALLIAAIAFVALRRRRVAEEAYYEEPDYAAPVTDDAPVAVALEPGFAPAAAPMTAMADEIAIADADHADVAALNADSEPAPGRPWLEFLMRPIRAGVDGDDATVEFELTVGNTGSTNAADVRVSTWMVAVGAGTDMERSLIEPPADAQHSELSIAAGDGARVDGAISLPKEGLRGSVLPVVVADARYTLPDGSEGRTHASFAVGLPSDDGLEPFAVDLPTGLQEGVEARLHGEPERV
ncbi:MAG: hypothetical protein QOG13_3042 [Sphingomonadales bacterium]|jgi:hypothetical protein|nr:hypothetical protein [Sphingomonadales bacterium]